MSEDAKKLARLISPEVHEANGCYWAIPQAFVGHGVGASPSEAIEDYGYGLVEYLEGLRERRDTLAPPLVEHLRFLEGLLRGSA